MNIFTTASPFTSAARHGLPSQKLEKTTMFTQTAQPTLTNAWSSINACLSYIMSRHNRMRHHLFYKFWIGNLQHRTDDGEPCPARLPTSWSSPTRRVASGLLLDRTTVRRPGTTKRIAIFIRIAGLTLRFLRGRQLLPWKFSLSEFTERLIWGHQGKPVKSGGGINCINAFDYFDAWDCRTDYMGEQE